MAKWHGKVGYVMSSDETDPGIWDEPIMERSYSGDTFRNVRLLNNSSDSTNDNVNITTQISIVADPYATSHFYDMRYVTFQGKKWKVTNVEERMEQIQIRDEFIKLGQALKLAGLVESGVDAKFVIQDGLVKVNGETEVRRGKKLYKGDVFSFEGQDVEVV